MWLDILSFIRKKSLFTFQISLVFLLLSTLPFITSSVKSQTNLSNPVIEEINDSLIKLNKVIINKNSKSISIPAKINMSKGLIEVVLCKSEGKTHESLLVTSTDQIELQTALLLLGFNPLNEVPGEKQLVGNSNKEIINQPDSLVIYIQWQDNNKTITDRIEKFIQNQFDNNQMKTCTWLFQGLLVNENGIVSGNDISMIVTYHDPYAILELNSINKFDDRIFYVNENFNLPVGTEVELIIQEIRP